MKTLLLLTLGLLTAGAASAATLSYTFETPDNISGTGTEEVYTAPDTNDFGSGITVSDFTMEDRIDYYSRFTDIDGGSVEAAVGGAGAGLALSFTLTIDDTVSVDLANILFDTSARWTESGSIDDVFVGFAVSVDSTEEITGTFDWIHDGNPNYQTVTGNEADLSALTGLTDTTVTFTWSLYGDRNNTFARIAYGLDDIVLTGTISAVPEPGNFVFGGLLVLVPVMARRRVRR